MDAQRITAEMDAVGEHLSRLQKEITGLEQWRLELHTALKVLERLDSTDPMQVKESDVSPAPTPASAVLATSTTTAGKTPLRPKRQITPAKGLAAEAGKALIEMLREGGKFLRPMEAVRRLRDERGIIIGLGKPGRETSDLSAAIGHGKISGLTVSRQRGWGLTQWHGTSVATESTFTTTSEMLAIRAPDDQAVEAQPSVTDDVHEPEPHLTESNIGGR